eukprot:gene32115-39665_t
MAVRESSLLTGYTSEGEYFPYSAQLNDRADLNAGIRSLADKYKPRVFVVDAASALPNGPRATLSAEVAAFWDEDGLHLTEKGSARLAQTTVQ